MATDYGATHGDVSARLSGRPDFTSSTSPTDSEVGAWLEEAEAKIHGALKRAGISTPVTDAEGIEILKALSIDYGEARVRLALAAAAGDGANDDGRAELERFDEAIASMRTDPAGWSAELGGGTADASTRRLRSHVTDDVDGRASSHADFKPEFTKSRGADQF